MKMHVEVYLQIWLNKQRRIFALKALRSSRLIAELFPLEDEAMVVVVLVVVTPVEKVEGGVVVVRLMLRPAKYIKRKLNGFQFPQCGRANLCFPTTGSNWCCNTLVSEYKLESVPKVRGWRHDPFPLFPLVLLLFSKLLWLLLMLTKLLKYESIPQQLECHKSPGKKRGSSWSVFLSN